MSFLFQLNLNNLPEVQQEDTIIQLFNCGTYKCSILNEYIHFSEKYLCRKQRITRTFIPTEKQFAVFTKNQTNNSGKIHIWNIFKGKTNEHLQLERIKCNQGFQETKD